VSLEPAPTSTAPRDARVLGRALFACGVLLLVLAILADARLVAALHFRGFPSSEALSAAKRSRVLFGAAGLLALLAGPWVRRTSRPRTRAGVGLVLIALCGGVPLFVAELALRPFVERLTDLYVVDEALGWRHRPGVAGSYWGEPVRINAHGMRGPERGPVKPSGARRVLFLGDSVVFGLALADEERTIPALLEDELATRTAAPVEVLNAAVCGWSTWQELRFLQAEGERWQPDLVLLGFVLNDVTERYQLVRFGGSTSGPQLAYAAADGWRAWLAESGLYLAVRELHLRRELRAAELRGPLRPNPYHVILDSDTEPVQAAWRQVLPELEAILAWCRERELPLGLVVFPYALQLDDPALDAPQWILTSFAERRALPCLDLLPAFRAAAHGEGGSGAVFLDGLHPTERGSALAAREIARFLREISLFR
jgi:lysophospholipase L1-like esterase